RGQRHEPRGAGRGRHRLLGAGLADALRRAGGRLSRLLARARADRGDHRRLLPVRGDARRARFPPATAARRQRNGRSDRRGAWGSRARRAGESARRDLARNRRPAAARRHVGDRRGRSGADAACGRQRRFGGRNAMISMDSALIFVVVIAVVIFIGSYAKILREYERGVIFRLGRNARALLNPGGTGNGPGLLVLAPFIDRMVKVSLQTVALDGAPQDVITRDHVSIKVSAVIYFRVSDPAKAVV